MAAPKKTRKKPQARKGKNKTTEPSMRIRGNLKLQFAAVTYELQAARAMLETQDAKIKSRAETDPIFAEAISMMSQRVQLEMDMSKATSKLYAVGRKVCDKLKVAFDDFKHYTIDTETGVVVHVPASAEAPDQETS